ncbi:beta-lactamase regulator AmpE [Pseudoalteromonas tunicata]|uniref:beta-lactamase regulator AmpE n=1 Tax=Pseudoalteromonas tunicata TaxID=314281 RepID=UPI00273E1365|nr:beta-lactamase regulator AmpE [Pseudoalteromonas tunicata]MDP4983229.1 beta-lactamase regulator AmpE [Pseudoalteromonas tunicata]MDP5211778.1 beta-lactamase regulator AmpE [Pseudoalteromonas tunicata]
MTLISILIALIIERLDARGKYWQMETYASVYLDKSRKLESVFKHSALLLFWLLLPAILVGLIAQTLDFVLWQMLINVVVLLVCLGCVYYREKYKGYLNAMQRNDNEAASLYAMQLGQKRTEDQRGGETLGQTLAWINFRFYCAVIFWFVVLGPAGAVFYALVRTIADAVRSQKIAALLPQKQFLQTLLFWLDWLPTRIASFGYLIIGNFNKGTSCWLRHALNFSVSNRKVITETALAAEQVEKQHLGCTVEALCMVKLVKRNVLFFLALIAGLTLFGQLS